MQHLGLSPAELRAYGRALTTQTHTASVSMRVLDLSGNLIRSLAPDVNSGQVDYNADQDVTRSGKVEFLDPESAFQFTSDSPSGAVYFDNMIRLWHDIRVPELGFQKVGCAVLTGPVTKFDREGQVVSLEFQGKESLAMTGVPTLTLRKGMNVIEAIRRILEERCGETSIAFPTTRRRLPKNVVVSWEENVWPWTQCKRLAASLGLHIFYDGMGTCRLRDLPQSSVFLFHDGEDANVRTQPQDSHDSSVLRNRWTVVGNKPKNTWTAQLTDTHPDSSWRMRRNGVRQYRTETINDPKVGSISAARARAEQARGTFERMVFGAGVTVFPIPHLDDLDLVRIETERHAGAERPRQWSFPVTGGDMTLGYNDIVSRPRVRTR